MPNEYLQIATEGDAVGLSEKANKRRQESLSSSPEGFPIRNSWEETGKDENNDS